MKRTKGCGWRCFAGCLLVLVGAALASRPGAHAASGLERTDFSKRVGIVYSAATANKFYSQFAYSTLFMGMQQHAMMAGLPFDLLTEDDLTDAARLVNYDALVFPEFPNVPAAKLAAIETALRQAVAASHIGILTCGNFLSNDENGAALPGDPYLRMKDLLGLRPTTSLSGVAATLLAEPVLHPVLKNYVANEPIFSWPQIWLSIYEPVAGQTATRLARLDVGGVGYNAVLATQTAGRNVHFANPAVLGDPNLAWSALRWIVYGDQTPVGLKLGRQQSLFVARNDMDQSKYASQIATVELPVYDLIADWKERYDFVGSFYINIGNDPANGQYTDWNVSGPLYRSYMALGNEIGTHSYTHPFDTATLTAEQLEFEFKESRDQIAAYLGAPVLGAAIPGKPESLFTDQVLNGYFSYLSGRFANVGAGYHGAYGYLDPSYQMVYFTLDLHPDYSLISGGKTPAEATQFWRDQYTALLRHASQPIVHWLWHDYGPTTGVTKGYSYEMYDDTLALAYQDNAEFVTTAETHNRIKALMKAKLTASGADTLTVAVTGSGLGAFAVEIGSERPIQSVNNWFAYSSNAVFVPQDGGQFTVQLGAAQDAVTRIVGLPMRAKLISVAGNGSDLDFTFEGEGVVSVWVNNPQGVTVAVQAADSVTAEGNILALHFKRAGLHAASVRLKGNHPPVAQAQALTVSQDTKLAVTLGGSDPDGDALKYAVVSGPTHGTLSGGPPALTYIPEAGFVGGDSFTFLVNDGQVDSNPATVSLAVLANNLPPTAVGQSLTAAYNTALPITLAGADPDGDPLTYRVVDGPAHGALTGAAPNVTYTPASGYSGPDEFTFTVNDGRLDSGAATIAITVSPAGASRLSNPVTSLTLDGSLADWAALTFFGLDPADATGAGDQLDWLEGGLAHDALNLYLAYRTQGAITLNAAYNVYLDTDTNAATGFRIGVLGADFLVQGSSVYRYTGTGTTWSWSFVGRMTTAVSGSTAELSLPRSWLGNSASFNLFFLGENVTFPGGTTRDYYPDNALGASAGLRFFQYSTATAINRPPAANPQAVVTSRDSALPITLSGSDPDGDTLTYAVVSNPANGALSGVAPALTYTPASGFAGADSFTFTVNDGRAASAPATVAITVSPAPVGPVSNPVAAVTVDGSLADWAGLTSFGPDPAEVTGTSNLLDWREVWLAHDAAKFYLAYQNNGPITLNWAYNAYFDTDADATTGYHVGALGAEYLGQGNLIYRYTGDGATWSWGAVGRMTTGVNGNLAEFAFPRSWLGNPTSLNVSFRGENVAYPGGTVDDYYPDNATGNLTGVRFFQYTTVSAINHPPVATPQAVTAAQDTAVSVTLAGVDPDGDPLTYAVAGLPANGALSGTAPNLTYTPAAGFVGQDAFSFTANDGRTASGAAAVTITVNALNHPPVANAQAVTTAQDTALSVTLTASDQDGNPLTYTVLSGPANGALRGTAPNLTYTPATGFTGPDSFTFKVNDGMVDSSAVLVSILVSAAPPPPQFSNPVAALTVDGALADWAGVTSFGPDPVDAPGANNRLDWLECWMAHDATKLYLAYRNNGPITLNWAYNVYLDTDSDATTGYRTGSLGAEYLIQGKSVYRYNGAGASWSWLPVGTMTYKVSGDTAEFAFARAWIGDPTSFKLFFRGDNTAYSGGTGTDFYPDNVPGTTTGPRSFQYTTVGP